MAQRIREWLDIRIGLDEIIRSQLTEYRIPKNINIFYTLGMVAFGAFALQVVTGILLIFYYIPSDKDAFQSVQFIMNQVPYGWLFRLMHVVGSNLMVAVVICHLGSVFFLGAYKKPRELTWVLGAFLLLTTLGFCLSGYLLAWSQLSFWATTVVTTMPQAFPFIGNFISEIMRGGENVSGAPFLAPNSPRTLFPSPVAGEGTGIRHSRFSLSPRMTGEGHAAAAVLRGIAAHPT